MSMRSRSEGNRERGSVRHRLGLAIVLAVAAAIGIVAPPSAQAAVTINPLKVVVVGDSYMAGNGARDAGGDRNYEGPGGCYRSPTNWSSQYADWVKTGADDAVTYRVTYVNRACSGGVIADYTSRRDMGTTSGIFVPGTSESDSDATVIRLAREDPDCRTDYPGDEAYTVEIEFYDNIYGGHYVACTRWMEPQVNAIGNDTDLVILTGGGNDVNFAAIVEQCFAPGFRDPGSCREKVNSARERMVQVEDDLVATLAEIRSRARPDMKVAVVGYPYLANNDDFELVYRRLLVTWESDRYAAAREVRDLGRLGDERQAAAVDRANAAAGEDFVSFVDLKDAFAGHEPKPELGTGNPDRWIAEFEGRIPAEFFHYNAEGHRQLAQHLRQFGTFGARGVGTGTSASVDLAFVIDTTGSMGADIAQVKASANAVLDRLDAGTQSYRVAVVDYRDYASRTGDPRDYPSRLVLDFSSDPDEIRNAIDSLDIAYGGDFRETMWSGFMEAFALDWRPGVKKVALQFGDAPPLNPEPFSGLDVFDIIIESLRIDPVAVYAIDTGSSGNEIREVAAATGGEVFFASTPSAVADQLFAALDAALASPYAWIGTVYQGRIGSPITFDGSGSYDPDGEIVSWEWDVDGDGVYDVSTAGPELVHTYTADYDGLITLRVTDNSGLIGLATAPVDVSVDGDAVRAEVDNCPNDHNPGQEDADGNGVGDVCDPDWSRPTEDLEGVGVAIGPPPTSTILNAPYSGSARRPIAIDGAVSDPDGDVVTSTWFTEAPCTFADPVSLSTTATCSEPGDHVIHLVADDGNGGIVADETTMVVTPVLFEFGGFQQPIDVDDVNVLNAGRTLPVKWSLTDADGAPVDDPASFVAITYQLFDCDTGAVDSEGPAASRKGLKSTGPGQWHFNWLTPAAAAGRCGTVTLHLSDGYDEAAREFRVRFR